jgi:hypothetical protein
LDALIDAEGKVNALETGMTFPMRFLEYGLGYSFSFFCKNAVRKPIGKGTIIVEFFSVVKDHVISPPSESP